MGLGGWCHDLTTLSLGMTRYLWEAGWASGLVLTGAKNLSSTRIQSPHHPACSELLYGLHYPSSVGKRTKNIQDSGCSVSSFINRTSIFSVYNIF